MRCKAWERATEAGLVGKIARAARVRPQTARRWFLEPDHPDRRAVQDNKHLQLLAAKFDLQPNDFVWLPGERAARRQAQKLRRAA